MTAPDHAPAPPPPGEPAPAPCPKAPSRRTGTIAGGLGFAIMAVGVARLWELGPAGPLALASLALTVAAAVFALIVAAPLYTDPQLDRRLRIAWRCFAAALVLIAGDATVAAVVTALAPAAARVAAAASAGLGLVSLVLFLAGMCWVPAEPLPRAMRVPAALDVATLSVAALLAFWIYALSPATNPAPASVAQYGAIAAHALVALALGAGLLMLLFRSQPAAIARGFMPFAAGTMLVLVFEVLPRSALLRAEGFAVVPAFFGWALLALCLGVSARAMSRPETAVDESRLPYIQFAVPFASTALVALLLFTSLVSREIWREHASVLLGATFGALLLIVVRQTITARDNLRLAQAMGQARDAAESANSARLQFLANISHDLRTPLNGILGCVQILLRETSITVRQRDLLRTMQGSAEHLRTLINDLLDLSKLEADRLDLAPTAFDLAAFLNELIKTFGLEADKKQLRLDLHVADDLPAWIECDRKRLRQILGNLVHNAIKFTDRGNVRVRARREGAELVFDVADTGCGMLPDQLEELFQPFHVVSERSIRLEGTGLGLSISRKLARRMGGDIAVQSVVSRGSTFTVRLPIVEAAPVVEVQRTVVDYQGRRRRILIVDDQSSNRVVLRNMLEPLDFLVDEADNAASALKNIRFARPDVILLDLMMPGVDGFELLAMVKELHLAPEPPLLAISALSGDEVDARCAAAGFRQLLNKPVNLDLLLDALHTHAGIEWTFGVIHPAPAPVEAAAPPPALVPPSPEDLATFLDLARRGFVRNLESRADQLARLDPRMAPFAERVRAYVSDFAVKELAEWLNTLSTPLSHGPS